MASVTRSFLRNYRKVSQRSLLFGKNTAFFIAGKRNFIDGGGSGGEGFSFRKYIEYWPLPVCITILVYGNYFIPLNIAAWFWSPPSIENWINEEAEGNASNCSFTSARYAGHYIAHWRSDGPKAWTRSVERKLGPFEMKFNAETYEIEVGESREFELSGMFNTKNGRIGMTQKFIKGVRKGECVEMRLAWNDSTNQFEGWWHSKWGARHGYSERDMGDICIYFYGNSL